MANSVYCQGCGDETENAFVCPICIRELGRTSFFCSQKCFASNWRIHNKVHGFMQKAAVYAPSGVASLTSHYPVSKPSAGVGEAGVNVHTGIGDGPGGMAGNTYHAPPPASLSSIYAESTAVVMEATERLHSAATAVGSVVVAGVKGGVASSFSTRRGATSGGHAAQHNTSSRVGSATDHSNSNSSTSGSVVAITSILRTALRGGVSLLAATGLVTPPKKSDVYGHHRRRSESAQHGGIPVPLGAAGGVQKELPGPAAAAGPMGGATAAAVSTAPTASVGAAVVGAGGEKVSLFHTVFQRKVFAFFACFVLGLILLATYRLMGAADHVLPSVAYLAEGVDGNGGPGQAAVSDGGAAANGGGGGGAGGGGGGPRPAMAEAPEGAAQPLLAAAPAELPSDRAEAVVALEGSRSKQAPPEPGTSTYPSQ
eukprot:GHVU01026600.1.p1 GENE.GHVU01026600.1~~GHVU01026600.1.p1  ORF type:complete len:426 (-),score=56.51 GHVU01026600.1:866-2143(-)